MFFLRVCKNFKRQIINMDANSNIRLPVCPEIRKILTYVWYSLAVLLDECLGSSSFLKKTDIGIKWAQI